MAKDSVISGKLVSLKLDVRQETDSGKQWRAHILKVKTKDGDIEKFKISTKSKPAQFVEKLEEGDDIRVQKGGKFNSVLAVYKGDFKKGGGKFGNKFEGKSYDPLGAIQGMVLKAAIDVAIAEAQVLVPDKHSKASITAKDIVSAAEVVLKAKKEIDDLVVKSRKSNDEDEDDDDQDEDELEGDESDSDDSEDDGDSDDEEDYDEERSKSRKKKSKDEPY